MKKTNKAFTLVELIVVITILAILGTIAFISLNGYSKTARDSTRISNLSTMKTSLELFHLDAGKYPLPTDSFTVTYSGSDVWNQGTFGIDTINNVDRLDKIPTDPLTDKEYTYSITKTKQEFQLAGIFESNDLVLNNTLFQTNAGDTIATAIVTGNYNGALIKTTTGITCEILSLPSIISSEITTDLSIILSNEGLVYNGFNNLPNNYISSKYKSDGGFAFTSNQLVVYSDTDECKPLYDADDNTARTELITNLQTAYSGTVVANKDSINNITTLDINNTESVDMFGAALLTNSLGGDIVASSSNGGGGGTTPLGYTLPSDLTQIFSAGSDWTKHWTSNSCDPATMNIIEVEPGANTIYAANGNSYNLQANTIYKLAEGEYITDNQFLVGNCSSIIGEGSVKIVSSIKINSIFRLDNSSNNNIIFNNIKIDGINDGSGGTHVWNKAGIDLWGNIDNSNITFNNIITFNNEYGIYFPYSGNNNIFNNFISHSNDSGIAYGESSNNNIFNNVLLYNNVHGTHLGLPNNFVFNNIALLNNDSLGLYMYNGSNNIINNSSIYSNNASGIQFDGGSSNKIYSSNIYNNSSGINTLNSSNKYYGTIKLYNDNESRTYFSAGTDGFLGWGNGILDETAITIDASWVVQPSVVGWDYTLRSNQTGLNFDGTETYTFGSNIPKQTQPVKWNGTDFEYYGVDGVDYDSTKYIGEW